MPDEQDSVEDDVLLLSSLLEDLCSSMLDDFGESESLLSGTSGSSGLSGLSGLSGSLGPSTLPFFPFLPLAGGLEQGWRTGIGMQGRSKEGNLGRLKEIVGRTPSIMIQVGNLGIFFKIALAAPPQSEHQMTSNVMSWLLPSSVVVVLNHVLAARKLQSNWLGGGRRKLVFGYADIKSEYLEQIGKWIANGDVKPVTDQVFAMENAVEAFRRLKTGRARGKVIVKLQELDD